MVVAVVVQTMLQLLAVRKLHEEDTEELDCVEVSLSEVDAGGCVAFAGSTSLRASNIGRKSFCRCLTRSTVSLVPFNTPSFNLLVVSMTQLTSENAVLNRPPINPR